MNEPLVTIIIPAFNRATLIEETLDSVRDQDHRSIELIVVDDGSTDATAATAEGWIARNKGRFTNVSLRTFTVNKGKSEAVNEGFKAAHGDYVMVLDSDDVLLPQAISTEVQFFRDHNEVDAVFAGAYLLDNRTRTEILVHTTQHSPSFTDVRDSYGDLLLKGNCIVASTVMMKRSVIQVLGGFRQGLRYTHDLEYWIRISKDYKFGYVDKPVLYYRMNVGDGSSLQLRGTFREICGLLNERAGEYSARSMVRAILFLTKFHIVSSYSKRSIVQSAMIAADGCIALTKYLLFRKLH